jgi:hypothetical protein
MTIEEARAVVGMLVLGFPAANVTKATAALYTEMLADLPHDATVIATRRMLSTARFFPTIAEVREAVAEVTTGPVRSGAEVWLDVVEQIRHEGWCGRPRWRDPVVGEIVRQWGWVRLCTEGNPDADRARFAEMYAAMARRRRIDVVAGALPAAIHPRLDRESTRHRTDIGTPHKLGDCLPGKPTGKPKEAK